MFGSEGSRLVDGFLLPEQLLEGLEGLCAPPTMLCHGGAQCAPAPLGQVAAEAFQLLETSFAFFTVTPGVYWRLSLPPKIS